MSQFVTLVLRKKKYIKTELLIKSGFLYSKAVGLDNESGFLQHRKENYKFKHNSITYIVNTYERIWWM